MPIDMNDHSVWRTFTCGVSTIVIATLILAVLTALGTLRVQQTGLAQHKQTLTMAQHDIRRNLDYIHALRADMQEIKAIVERIERKVEPR